MSFGKPPQPVVLLPDARQLVLEARNLNLSGGVVGVEVGKLVSEIGDQLGGRKFVLGSVVVCDTNEKRFEVRDSALPERFYKGL